MPYSNIAWIKAEIRLLNDYRHYTLPEDAQLIYFKFLLLAGQTNNQIPKNSQILSSIFRSTSKLDRIEECIDLIKKNFPKFKENAHYYYFSEWSNRHNWVVPKEIQRSSYGMPKEPIEENRTEEEKEREKEIQKLVELFKPLNPITYRKWYSNTTQRAAVGRLEKALGEKLNVAIEAAAENNGKPYAPVITTPLQLEDKLPALRAFLLKDKSNQKWHILS